MVRAFKMPSTHTSVWPTGPLVADRGHNSCYQRPAPCASPSVGALLANRKLETLGFIYVGEPRPPLRNASCPTLPPQPFQRLG